MVYYDMYGNPMVIPPQVNAPNGLQQPQMNFQPQNCQCENRFMWIQGKEAAKAYPVAPDKTIFFLDDKESYAYLKKTDKDGKTIDFKTFQLIEEKDPEPEVPESAYISKQDFNAYADNVNKTLVQLMEKVDKLGNRPVGKPYNKKEVRDDV